MGGPRELESMLGEGDPSVDLGQQFDVPPATVVQDQIVGGHEGSVFRDVLEPEEAQGLAEGATASGKESAPVDADAFIRGSEGFDALISTLDDDEVPLEDKLVAIKDFLKDVRSLLDEKKVSYPDGFSKIPVIAEIIREDVDLAGQYQQEVEQAKAQEKNERAAQILKDALEEVNTTEWVNKPPQERIAFLRGHVGTATGISPDIAGESLEYKNVENFIKDLQKLQREEEKLKSSGMPVRPEKVGFFGRIKGWFSKRKENAEREKINNSIEELYGRFINEVKEADLSLQDQVNALEVFIEDAKKMAGGADWVMECRSVLDASRAIEERRQEISREMQEEAASNSSAVEDKSGMLMDDEILGSGPVPFAKPNYSAKNEGMAELDASAEPEDGVEVSSSDEAVSPPVESIRINAVPKAETPAAQAPSFEVDNQVAERTPVEAAAVVGDGESNPGNTVESASAPTSVDAGVEDLKNQAEVFAVGLRNAFRKLQESRMVGGKAEKITSGEAYARFTKLLAEEIRITAAQPAIIKQVLQETFDKETRSAPRVILGMALRERGVTVKMKDGELSRFKRVEK